MKKKKRFQIEWNPFLFIKGQMSLLNYFFLLSYYLSQTSQKTHLETET